MEGKGGKTRGLHWRTRRERQKEVLRTSAMRHDKDTIQAHCSGLPKRLSQYNFSPRAKKGKRTVTSYLYTKRRKDNHPPSWKAKEDCTIRSYACAGKGWKRKGIKV